MSRPVTRASNSNKHPGKIVLEANRVQRSKAEVAAEKNRKQAEKVAKTAATDQKHSRIAAIEDSMAIQQRLEATGPQKPIRPRPRTKPVSDGGYVPRVEQTSKYNLDYASEIIII